MEVEVHNHTSGKTLTLKIVIGLSLGYVQNNRQHMTQQTDTKKKIPKIPTPNNAKEKLNNHSHVL